MLLRAARYMPLPLLLILSPPALAQDKLKIQGIAGGDNVVVMLDARTGPGPGGCKQDAIRRSTGVADLGNLLAPSADCPSELAILSKGNAMKFESPVTTWTDSAGDVHTVVLDRLIDVPVKVWVADHAGKARPQRHVKRTKAVYLMNRVGMRLDFEIEDVSANTDAVRIINAGLVSPAKDELECTQLKDIQDSQWYTPKTLNVYYVTLKSTGRNCALLKKPTAGDCREDDPGGDGNITFIGTDAHRGVLAHELGHAFGLRPGAESCGGHTNNMKGFGKDNIMWVSKNANMNHFSLGQVFRMNTHSGSMLVRNGQRPDLGRSCPTSAKGPGCPPLEIDWPGHGSK